MYDYDNDEPFYYITISNVRVTSTRIQVETL